MSDKDTMNQEQDDIAIQVSNLSKCYQIYDTPRDRLKQFILPRIQHAVGRRQPAQYFREFWALKDVSFEVRKGETVGIIGRNGSGKSTLLQMICGTLNPTAGSITTHGRIAALLELGSGFNPEFTGRENVYMNASVLGLSKEEIDQRFDDIAAFADIGEFIEQPVKTYSSGMMVRLAFAVIAHVDAEILVVDEALAVGDAFFVQKCMRFIRQFQNNSGTLLFVSHDIGAINSLCQQASWIHNGVLYVQGRAKDVTAAYMTEIYESQQGPSKLKMTESESMTLLSKDLGIQTCRDMRLDYINRTKYRNDIELFVFKEDAKAFGKGEASIENVEMQDDECMPLKWIVGGEAVHLQITCCAHKDIFSPIVGFFIKDRLGQVLFGDNTYISYIDNPFIVPNNKKFIAIFSFVMPLLPMGDYSINVALAEGTQMDHVQHHWIHDALLFRSISSSITTGLVGIPMRCIQLKLND